MEGQKFFILAGILISIIIILSSVSLAVNRISYSGRAQVPTSTAVFSKENSYLFASPISAPANSKSVIRISIFILNDQGLGVSGLKIKLSLPASINVGETQPITDSFGRAIFDLTSGIAGNYTIAAESQGVSLPQSISVSFR